ncbi:MAG: AMP-binding protein [Actinobacteria bacterium]|nr:AMP-binding protein [Actinomycetota bacterium]
MALQELVPRIRAQAADVFWAVGVLREAGVLRPIRPDRLARAVESYARLGTSPALGSTAAAITRPDEVAIVDEIGTLTFAETHARSNSLARALAERGIGAGDGVGIMCRNHRYFIEATMACAKLGAVGLYLNTSFAGPQLAEVMEREDASALIYDEEFSELREGVSERVAHLVAWHEAGGRPAGAPPTVEDMIAEQPGEDLPPPEESGRYVILTSGTTGTPKGAQRGAPEGLGPIASFLSKIPRRSGETVVISAPLFHSWGLSHFLLGLPLGATMVLHRRFDPEDTLRAVAEHRARTLVVVPVMMQRILKLGDEVKGRYDAGCLQVTAASGSALPGELATRWMDEFGDNLYNLYGSTEVAWATIATPEDMRAAPGTAGRTPRGTVVRIVDEQGRELPAGETGRIFVSDGMAFEGYTGGGDKERLDGLLSSGDVGHFDEGGRLFIDGRDDEMIVSGGENVFPREVEDLLADHEAVSEAAAIGVPDEEFGQRLLAFAVLADGAEVGEDELKDHVKANLARYKVPRTIIFIDELPRNATGKVLKRQLTEREPAG